MRTPSFKRLLSSLLAIIMVLTMCPVAFVAAAETQYPMMEVYNSASSGDYHKYYNKIYSVTFLDAIDDTAIEAAGEFAWDVSAAKDGSVMAWMKKNAEQSTLAGDDRYDVFIAGNGGVGANPDSSWIFYAFSSLAKINNPQNFKTDKVTTFFNMFANCYLLESVDLHSWDVSNVTSLKNMFAKCYALTSANLSGWDTSSVTDMSGLFDMTDNTNRYPESILESVDLTGWNTSNVTTMENMFKNCEVLPELDLSSFNTAKLTNMRYMFFYCKALKNIYIGDGWTTESIANISDPVFNCCYAIMGGKEVYDNKFYIPPDATYAKLKEEGGFLTHESEKPQPEKKEYTVTYEFVGDLIPDGVSVIDPVVYEEGTTVTVADVPSADGYVFSGWSTDDADIESGSFVIENDVHFVGSWEKVYTVSYSYTPGFAVPDSAPTLPATVTYTAGTVVNVADLPVVEGYVFVGWETEDASVTDNKFLMPEQDVILQGYFKKPVESVEINGDGGNITLTPDEETYIHVIVKPEDATVKEIVYESDNENVVRVDENGKVTAVGEGTATITVSSKDDPTKKDTITITVKVPVEDIEVTKDEFILYVNDTDKIDAYVVPPNATNKELTYTSGNEDIVKVDENGTITAVGEGTTTITIVSVDDPTVTETVVVTVKVPVTEITATDDFTLYVGEEKNVEASVNEDATNKELIYETSDPGVAKVDNDGNVIAVGEGTTTITVISKDDPTVREEIVVTVERKKYKVTYEFVGDTIPDGVSVADPAEYKEGTIVIVEKNPSADGYEFSGWSTDDADITSGSFVIENDVHIVGSWEKLYNVKYVYTGEVPAGAPALNTYTHKAGDGVVVDAIPFVDGYVFVGWTTSDVEVSGNQFAMPENDVTLYGYFKKPVDSVEINGGDIVLNKDGETTLKVTVKPEDATIKDLVYESEDETVAKVDENGKITAVGEGTTTITVYSKDDPSKKDTITVTVKIPVTDITVEKTEYTLIKDESEKITVIVTPDEATNKEMTFTSEDESIVKVDEDGNITAVGEGTTTITVTSKDNPSVKEEIKVTVELKKYKVTYEFVGELIPDGVSVADPAEYKEGTIVIVEKNPSADGYVFSGWSTEDAEIASGSFVIENDVHIIGSWSKIPVTDITVDKTEIELKPGETDKITVTVTPDNATNKDVTFTSEDESVVKVDEDGNIIAVGEGTTTITVTSKDNPSVKEEIKVTVELKKYKVTYEFVGDTIPEGVSVAEPAEYKEGTTVIVEKNPSADGYVFSGWSTDDAEIASGSFVIENDVHIIGSWSKIPVTDITVDKTEIELKPGETDKITVSVTPDNATDKEVIYTSEDESIVKVDEDGNITAVGEGTTTITVTSKDNSSVKEEIKVTVVKPEEPTDPEEPSTDPEEPSTDPEEPSTDPEEPSTEPEEPSTEPEEPSTEPEEPSTDPEEPSTDPEEPSTDPEEPSTDPEEPSTEPEEPSTEPEEPSTEPEEPSDPEEPTDPEYVIEVPERIILMVGQTVDIGLVVTPDDGTLRPVYSSDNEAIVKVDENGRLTAVSYGIVNINVTLANGAVYVVPVAVFAVPEVPKKHHIAFGKTDGIGWYEVSVNGGDFFPQGPNSTLEVDEGSVLVVRVQDMWIDDEFDFYVNGKRVKVDAANTITVVVDGYMLIGALSMDVTVPDVEESITILQMIINFFKAIVEWFKNLFNS